VQGIRFRGHTIPELQKVLPTAQPKGEPIPEGLLWLLLTGEVPTAAQAKSVTEELHERAKLPAHVETLIRSLPKGMHPMTQLSTAVLAMQTDSKFAKAYHAGACAAAAATAAARAEAAVPGRGAGLVPPLVCCAGLTLFGHRCPPPPPSPQACTSPSTGRRPTRT
jgi:citrate synthase